MTSSQVFDALAPTYDDAFTNTLIGRYLRARVQARLDRHFHPGDHVLELGCGTGEDALHLAGRGVHVTATDASPAMLDIAGAKAQGNPLVQIKRLDLRQLPSASGQSLNSALSTQHSAPHFDGAFSNFGALNCLDDWRPLAAWLAGIVRPGGMVGFGIMSPLCLWEPLWHGLHLDFRTAARRWRKNAPFHAPTDSASPPPEAITIRYPTIGRITRDFAPHFRRVHVEGIGLFLPPSDVFGALDKRPRLLAFLMNLERRAAKYAKLALFADHYWIEFSRQ